MTYEQDLNEACKALGYDSYAHYCEVEKTDNDPSQPEYLYQAWKRLYLKALMHRHFDFSTFVYPLICANFGVVFTPDGPNTADTELHVANRCIEYMRWLVDDLDNPDHQLDARSTTVGTTKIRNMIIDYMKKYNPNLRDSNPAFFRDHDFVVATGLAIKRLTDPKFTTKPLSLHLDYVKY